MEILHHVVPYTDSIAEPCRCKTYYTDSLNNLQSENQMHSRSIILLSFIIVLRFKVYVPVYSAVPSLTELAMDWPIITLMSWAKCHPTSIGMTEL